MVYRTCKIAHYYHFNWKVGRNIRHNPHPWQTLCVTFRKTLKGWDSRSCTGIYAVWELFMISTWILDSTGTDMVQSQNKVLRTLWSSQLRSYLPPYSLSKVGIFSVLRQVTGTFPRKEQSNVPVGDSSPSVTETFMIFPFLVETF